jgi:hemoglobin/transferrin/lactoferrin receptor protein
LRLGARCIASASALALFAGHTSAQSAEAQSAQSLPPIEQIVVTATRIERPLDSIPRSVSVIGRAEIERRRPTDVVQLLRELPGVSAASNGGLSGQLVVRGFSTNGFRAPLFVDGDRFRGRNTLEYMLFDPQNVERIEVVRGPAASLYGTDSFGGVVNIITRRAEGDVFAPFRFSDTRLDLGYDSVNGQLAVRAQIGGAGNGWDVRASASYRTAGDYKTPMGRMPNSDFELQSFDARIGYSFAPGQRLELTAKKVEVERGRPGGEGAAPGAFNPPNALNRIMREDPIEERFLRLAYQGEFDGAFRGIDASAYVRNLDTLVRLRPDARTETRQDSYVIGPRVWGGRLLGRVALADTLDLTIGGDTYYEDRPGSKLSLNGAPQTQNAPDSTQLNAGAFALLDWRAHERLTLQASGRYDYVSTDLNAADIANPAIRDLFAASGKTKNNPVTGSAGAIVSVTDEIGIIANASTAFRAPSVTELVAVAGVAGATFRVPNPQVGPEKATTYEAGLRFRFAHVNANLVVFSSRYTDLIDRNVRISFNNAPAVQIQNIGRARMRGLEFDAQWVLTAALRATLTATAIRGTDLTSARPLAQIPSLNGTLGLRYEPPGNNWFAQASLNWQTDKSRVEPTNERPRQGFAVLNLYGGFSLDDVVSNGRDNIRFTLGIENVFDDRYTRASTPENVLFAPSPSNPLIEPGRNFKFGVSLKI